MALKKCKECGGQVSTQAEHCPSCGAKQKRESKVLPLLLIFFCILIVGAVISPHTDNKQSAETTSVSAKKTPVIRSEEEIRDVELRVDRSIAGDLETQSRRTIKTRMKDPDSVEFKNVFGSKSPDGVFVCGQVNSKNSFGAYTGFTRFIGGGKTVFLEGTDETNPPFPDLWVRLCLNRL